MCVIGNAAVYFYKCFSVIGNSIGLTKHTFENYHLFWHKNMSLYTGPPVPVRLAVY